MEGDLKQLLRDRADEARIDPTIPPVILRRARRRRVGTIAMTGLVAAAVVTGALVGVRSALDRGGALRLGAQQETTGREVVGFVADFLQARLAGSGAEAFLSAEAERTYREEVDGLSLYGGDRGPYGGYDIYTHPRETDGGWSIVVLVKWPDPQGEEDRFVAESLQLGPGQDLEGRRQPLVIRNVFPGASRGEVKDFIEGFMDSRGERSSSLIHDYLSPAALADYESRGKGLSLYPPEGSRLEYDLVNITPPLRGDHWQVRLRARFKQAAGETTVLERLTVGPGTTLRGFLAPLLVLGVGQELDVSRPDVRAPQPGNIASDEECGAPGSISDLSLEPRYTEAQRLERWTTSQGCDVRLDVLMTRRGPEHCGWQRATDILMGDPLGASHMQGPARVYVRDPDNVMGDPAVARAFEEDTDLPIGARDTGYRQDGVELWMDPTDDGLVYLVSEHAVERWPQDPSPAVCA
jgi:hypothetical protein